MSIIQALAALALTTTPASQPLPVHVGGRVIRADDGAMHFGWPGVYFEGRFRGTGFTLVVESGTEHMRLLVDGEEKALLTRPGRASLTLSGLPAGQHVVRLEKQTESQTGGGRFLGFFPEADGVALPPTSRLRQIEFIGDSYTLGYGNTSPDRTCSTQEVHDRTDTQRAFGALVARQLEADYRINAYSGFGIVRNYNGSSPGLSLPTIYPRLIPEDGARLEGEERDWRPQLIVINLGTNDFSTPLRAGEPWPDENALRRAYRDHYRAFLTGLIKRHARAHFILMGSDAFFGEVQQIAAGFDPRSRARITTLRFGDLDQGGCDWHPSLKDHLTLRDLLAGVIGKLPLGWQSDKPAGSEPLQ